MPIYCSTIHFWKLIKMKVQGAYLNIPFTIELKYYINIKFSILRLAEAIG